MHGCRAQPNKKARSRKRSAPFCIPLAGWRSCRGLETDSSTRNRTKRESIDSHLGKRFVSGQYCTLHPVRRIAAADSTAHGRPEFNTSV
jgi:hypothetical protein